MDQGSVGTSLVCWACTVVQQRRGSTVWIGRQAREALGLHRLQQVAVGARHHEAALRVEATAQILVCRADQPHHATLVELCTAPHSELPLVLGAIQHDLEVTTRTT